MNKRPFIDRRALFASGAAAALLAATGLSARPGPVRGGRLRIALSGATRADRFDTSQEHGLFMKVAMVGIVFDTLTEIAADGTLRGELAESWESDAEARVWDFHLRPDVMFHDGSRLEPKDVSGSFALHKNQVLSDVVSTVSSDEAHLRITLSSGDPDFPYRLSDPRLVIYPSGNMAAAMAQGIGTGLYRVHRFVPGRQFIGNRVESHYKDGQAGWFDSIELVGLSSDAVRAEALRDHYVDAADLSHTADLNDLENFKTLPEENFMTAAVDRCIAVPAQVGGRWPMDNLRAAERWWMA